MGKHEKTKCRCPFGDRMLSFIFCISILLNSICYYAPVVSAEELIIEAELEEIVIEESIDSILVEEPIEEVSITEPEPVIEPEPIEESVEESPVMEHEYYDQGLTKSGGVYWNPYTGLKETWYSQRVLPGGGLDIPGRYVNAEGFVCDGDGYICVSSSTYSKGTVIETSRGMGKVYDSGCAPGVLDIYTDW